MYHAYQNAAGGDVQPRNRLKSTPSEVCEPEIIVIVPKDCINYSSEKESHSGFSRSRIVLRISPLAWYQIWWCIWPRTQYFFGVCGHLSKTQRLLKLV